jgi:amino acid adenylation domain-containing protein
MLVHQFLRESAERYPEKSAIRWAGHALSYGEFARNAARFGRSLAEGGVGRGARVLIWLPNGTEACVAIFGALEAGAVFVPVHRSTKPHKILSLIGDCRPAALVTDVRGAASLVQYGGALLDLLLVLCGEGALDGLPGGGRVSRYDDFVAPSVPEGSFPVNDQDLAALIYTSGSTGLPKGVMCAHHNVVAAARSIVSYLGNTADDILFNALPLSFDYGLYQLLMSCLIGGTLVLEANFTFPVRAVEVMRREGITGLPGVPSMFSLLLQLSDEKLSIPSLRYMTNTGAALPVSHIQELRRRLSADVRIFCMYGQTECKRTLYLPPDRLTDKVGSVGVPIPGEEAFLWDEGGRAVAPGTVGELYVRGPNVMQGYWERPEETAATFVPGPRAGERLLRTHDLFWQDEEGFFYFVSRRDSIIKSRGQKVSPMEVEAAILQLDGVAEVGVVGVPHEIWGEAIEAFVVPRATHPRPILPTEVARHCRSLVEDYMVPERVYVVPSLPHTDSGKVDYPALREARARGDFLVSDAESAVCRAAVDHAVGDEGA